jgi:hypothetical protein
MKTFSSFLAEVYDRDVMGSSQIKKTGEGGRIGADRRKTAPERRRMKAVGGGKMEPVGAYKDRKDIGYQRGSQTPELKAGTAGTKGSATLTAKERQRKAYLERKAKESGKSQPDTAKQAINQAKPKPTEKAASKPRRQWKTDDGGGMTRKERDAARNKEKGAALKARKAELIKDFTEKNGRPPKGAERTKLIGLAHKAVKAGI